MCTTEKSGGPHVNSEITVSLPVVAAAREILSSRICLYERDLGSLRVGTLIRVLMYWNNQGGEIFCVEVGSYELRTVSIIFVEASVQVTKQFLLKIFITLHTFFF